MIYLDNAASTWPKPPGVSQAMVDSIESMGANPGRAGHDMALQAGRLIYEVREKVASLFGLADALQVVFTANATEALNTTIFGILQPGDHVVTSSLEHNSVARPLHAHQASGGSYTVVKADPATGINLDDVRAAIQERTKLLVFTHASNVFGTLLPIAELAAIAHQHGIPILVDAAQTAGVFPIDMTEINLDYLAAAGHKSLMGPQGTGILCINRQDPLRPSRYGGTGSRSESLDQPSILPDRLESGTPNTPGVAGLAAGLDYIAARGMHEIRCHESSLITYLMQQLAAVPQVKLYGPPLGCDRAPLLSFNLGELDSAWVGHQLNRRYGIAVRAGLHCSPWAHQSAGTLEQGTVRISVGAFNTTAEMDTLVSAVKEMVNDMEQAL